MHLGMRLWVFSLGSSYRWVVMTLFQFLCSWYPLCCFGLETFSSFGLEGKRLFILSIAAAPFLTWLYWLGNQKKTIKTLKIRKHSTLCQSFGNSALGSMESKRQCYVAVRKTEGDTGGCGRARHWWEDSQPAWMRSDLRVRLPSKVWIQEKATPQVDTRCCCWPGVNLCPPISPPRGEPASHMRMGYTPGDGAPGTGETWGGLETARQLPCGAQSKWHLEAQPNS